MSTMDKPPTIGGKKITKIGTTRGLVRGSSAEEKRSEQTYVYRVDEPDTHPVVIDSWVGYSSVGRIRLTNAQATELIGLLEQARERRPDEDEVSHTNLQVPELGFMVDPWDCISTLDRDKLSDYEAHEIRTAWRSAVDALGTLAGIATDAAQATVEGRVGFYTDIVTRTGQYLGEAQASITRFQTLINANVHRHALDEKGEE